MSENLKEGLDELAAAKKRRNKPDSFSLHKRDKMDKKIRRYIAEVVVQANNVRKQLEADF